MTNVPLKVFHNWHSTDWEDWIPKSYTNTEKTGTIALFFLHSMESAIWIPAVGVKCCESLSTLTNISNHDGTSSLRHSASTPNQKLFCNVRIVVFRWFWKETVQSRSRWIDVWGIDKRMQNKDSPYDFSKVLAIWHACTPTKVDKTWEPENWVFMLFNRAFVSGSATNQQQTNHQQIAQRNSSWAWSFREVQTGHV